jgi:hypothetical protein
MDGLIPFLYATAMPPIRENGRTNLNITISVHAYHEMEGPIRTLLPPCHSYTKNGWTYTILERDNHATNTLK